MSARRAGAVAALVPAVLLPAVTSGCAVSEPDESGWTDAARQSLEDEVSSAETTRLALAQRSDGHLTSSYAVVVARDAEEQAGTSATTFTTQQPPPGHHRDYRRLASLLDASVSAVANGRIALVADDPAAIDRAGHRLKVVLSRLRRTEGALP